MRRMEIGALTLTSLLIGCAALVYDSADLTNFRRFAVSIAVCSVALLLSVHGVLKRELLTEVAEERAAARADAAVKTQHAAQAVTATAQSTARNRLAERPADAGPPEGAIDSECATLLRGAHDARRSDAPRPRTQSRLRGTGCW